MSGSKVKPCRGAGGLGAGEEAGAGCDAGAAGREAGPGSAAASPDAARRARTSPRRNGRYFFSRRTASHAPPVMASRSFGSRSGGGSGSGSD